MEWFDCAVVACTFHLTDFIPCYDGTVNIRRNMRKEKGIYLDCRTLRDVPGRNMKERLAA